MLIKCGNSLLTSMTVPSHECICILMCRFVVMAGNTLHARSTIHIDVDSYHYK